MENRNKTEARKTFEIEVVKFFEYFRNTAVQLRLNISESNSWNHIAVEVFGHFKDFISFSSYPKAKCLCSRHDQY
jgi:hypothetical protein